MVLTSMRQGSREFVVRFYGVGANNPPLINQQNIRAASYKNPQPSNNSRTFSFNKVKSSNSVVSSSKWSAYTAVSAQKTTASASDSSFISSPLTATSSVTSSSTSNPPSYNDTILPSLLNMQKRNLNDSLERHILGVVVAQTDDANYVYAPCLPREAILLKHLSDSLVCDPINLGQWIEFIARVHSNNRIIILSFSFVISLFPTLPSYNTIMLECKILIPPDYKPEVYGCTVKSEFMPQVADQDLLIRKCHHGKVLTAIMRRTKTSIPNVSWTIEYIKF